MTKSNSGSSTQSHSSILVKVCFVATRRLNLVFDKYPGRPNTQIRVNSIPLEAQGTESGGTPMAERWFQCDASSYYLSSDGGMKEYAAQTP